MSGNSQTSILSMDSTNKIKKAQCHNCNKGFSNKYNVSRHLQNNTCNVDDINIKLSIHDIQEIIKENRMMKDEIEFVKEENKVVKQELSKAYDKILYYKNNILSYSSSNNNNNNNTNSFNNINTMNMNNIHNLNIYFDGVIPVKSAVSYMKLE